ncbi:MAG TPA: HEAT repeat domain-containing protein [Kofleriaceae bacterium]|nr:HEAT repeat domain-containing protein [Kofleriaceae bacterium]
MPLARPRLPRPSWPLALLVVLLLAWPGAARADQVDRLIAQLRSASDYKVRLSAALNLAKIGDRRAIPVFVRALKDTDKTVRGVAAAGLGKLVTSATPASLRKQAMAALRTSAAKDSNAFVRRQAQKAYQVLRAIDEGGGGGAVAAGATYVNIGGMSAETRNSGTIRSVMRRTVAETFRKKASRMVTDWPGGEPSARELKARRVSAFHVDGTVNEIRVSGGLVECKVSMLLATYPQKSMFGFLKGGAKVEAGRSQSDIDAAAQDCVAAVAEDLIARKIIPTIQARAGQ